MYLNGRGTPMNCVVSEGGLLVDFGDAASGLAATCHTRG
jgi:hypothetical protein